MASAGLDFHNLFDKLDKELAHIRYPNKFTPKIVLEENPVCFLGVIHYALIDYSPLIYQHLVDKNYELYAKTDYNFMTLVYQIMVKEFGLKPPPIPVDKFFESSYPEVKLHMCLAIISQVLALKEKLEGPKKKSKTPKEKPKVLVVRHDDNDKENICQNPEGHQFMDEQEIVPEPHELPIQNSRHREEICTPLSVQNVSQQCIERFWDDDENQKRYTTERKEILKMIVDINSVISAQYGQFTGYSYYGKKIRRVSELRGRFHEKHRCKDASHGNKHKDDENYSTTEA